MRCTQQRTARWIFKGWTQLVTFHLPQTGVTIPYVLRKSPGLIRWKARALKPLPRLATVRRQRKRLCFQVCLGGEEGGASLT